MELIKPTKSWKNLSTHYKYVLSSDWYRIVNNIQTEIVKSTHDFYKGKKIDFMLLPITTGSISSPMGLGSNSLPVSVEIDGVQTFLADSMQFLLEFGCRLNKSGVYYIAPSFRGEKADKRHLCQFFHSEAEIPGNLDDVINLVEEYIKFLVVRLKKYQSENIKKITGTTTHLDNLLGLKSFPRCSFEEALVILKNSNKYVINKKDFRVINSLGERELIKHFNGCVWLTYFDHLSVPFYQKFLDEDKSKAKNADLLIGIGETVGSGERHFDGKEVITALDLHQVSKKDYGWYIDTKEKIQMQTSGFGMGIERFLLWILKHNDIRDVQILPRFNGVHYKI